MENHTITSAGDNITSTDNVRLDMKQENKQENQPAITPVGGYVLLKGVAQVSQIQMRSETLPNLKWRLTLESVGTDAVALRNLQGVVVLEYMDKVLPTIIDNNLSWNRQQSYAHSNNLNFVHKVDIVEYFITPVYNVVGILRDDVLQQKLTTDINILY